MTETQPRFLARQGDVIVRAVDGIPAGAVPVSREGGSVVIARGNATGHRHHMPSENVEMLRTPDGARYLRVTGDDVELVHDEHVPPIAIPRGEYVAAIQVEHAPEAPRQVED